MERTRFSILDRQPYPLLFVAVSGSRLYGFATIESNYDLRGAHVTPARDLLGLHGVPAETVEETALEHAHEQQLVTHDIGKFCRLLVAGNGFVLEDLYSPLVALDNGSLQELREIARTCITVRHYEHYRTFAYKQWSSFLDNPVKHAARLLHVFRILLTGIHLMRTGEVESNISVLNESFNLPYIDELVSAKLAGRTDEQPVTFDTLDIFGREFERLEAVLAGAAAASSLPREPRGEAALNDLLLRIRLDGVGVRAW